MSDETFIDEYGFKGPRPVTSTQRMVRRQIKEFRCPTPR